MCTLEYDNDSITYEIGKNLAANYGNFKNSPQATFYLNATTEAINRYYGVESIEAVLHLCKIAESQENIHDNYFGALTTRKKIIQLQHNFDFSELSLNNKVDLLDNQVRLASIYAILGNTDQAREELKMAQMLRSQLNFSSDESSFSSDLFTSYAYLKIGELEKAERIITNQHSVQEPLLSGGNYYASRLIFAKTVCAEVFIEQEKHSQACAYALEANQLLETYEPDALAYEAYVKYVLGKALLEAKRYKEAERIISHIANKLNKFGQTHYESTNFVNLAQLNELLARCYHEQYLATRNDDFLGAAIISSQTAQAALENAWRNFNNPDDLRYNLTEFYEIFETSFYIQYSLYQSTHKVEQLHESLRLMERSRNTALRTSLRKRTVAEELGIPNHFVDKDERLRRAIFELEYQISQATNQTNDDLDIDLQQKKEELLALNEEIDAIAPDFINAMQETPLPSDRKIKAYLNEQQQTIVYYTSGEEGTYLIALSPEQELFQRVPIGQDSLRVLVDQLRTTIYAKPGEPALEDSERLATTSHQLYELLLAPIKDIATDRLVIIPDGPLEIIPFSLLLSEDINPTETPLKEWPYAIRKYSFNYAYSLDLLLRPQENKQTDTKQKILAFAPNFQASILRGDSTRFQGELHSNQDEVAFIADQFACKAYFEEEALLSTFRAEAPNYSVLHLATHASANTEIGDYSYLAFSDVDKYNQQLQVGELYSMDIPADLVVLSACETGLGEWQRGEGVIGLERAFSYAGAKSLVTTHWKVSDRASAKLMSQFYDQLATGLTKDVALQQAQLAFINEHEDWLAHPFFWAGYVQKGDTAPLEIPRKKGYLLWLLGGATLLASLAYRRYSKSKKTAA